MTVPNTARAFENWLESKKADMPPELYASAYRALLSLKAFKLNKSNASALDALVRISAPDFEAFAKAYAEWQAHQKS